MSNSLRKPWIRSYVLGDALPKPGKYAQIIHISEPEVDMEEGTASICVKLSDGVCWIEATLLHEALSKYREQMMAPEDTHMELNDLVPMLKGALVVVGSFSINAPVPQPEDPRDNDFTFTVRDFNYIGARDNSAFEKGKNPLKCVMHDEEVKRHCARLLQGGDETQIDDTQITAAALADIHDIETPEPPVDSREVLDWDDCIISESQQTILDALPGWGSAYVGESASQLLNQIGDDVFVEVSGDGDDSVVPTSGDEEPAETPEVYDAETEEQIRQESDFTHVVVELPEEEANASWGAHYREADPEYQKLLARLDAAKETDLVATTTAEAGCGHSDNECLHAAPPLEDSTAWETQLESCQVRQNRTEVSHHHHDEPEAPPSLGSKTSAHIPDPPSGETGARIDRDSASPSQPCPRDVERVDSATDGDCASANSGMPSRSRSPEHHALSQQDDVRESQPPAHHPLTQRDDGVGESGPFSLSMEEPFTLATDYGNQVPPDIEVFPKQQLFPTAQCDVQSVGEVDPPSVEEDMGLGVPLIDEGLCDDETQSYAGDEFQTQVFDRSYDVDALRSPGTKEGPETRKLSKSQSVMVASTDSVGIQDLLSSSDDGPSESTFSSTPAENLDVRTSVQTSDAVCTPTRKRVRERRREAPSALPTWRQQPKLDYLQCWARVFKKPRRKKLLVKDPAGGTHAEPSNPRVKSRTSAQRRFRGSSSSTVREQSELEDTGSSVGSSSLEAMHRRAKREPTTSRKQSNAVGILHELHRNAVNIPLSGGTGSNPRDEAIYTPRTSRDREGAAAARKSRYRQRQECRKWMAVPADSSKAQRMPTLSSEHGFCRVGDLTPDRVEFQDSDEFLGSPAYSPTSAASHRQKTTKPRGPRRATFTDGGSTKPVAWKRGGLWPFRQM